MSVIGVGCAIVWCGATMYLAYDCFIRTPIRIRKLEMRLTKTNNKMSAMLDLINEIYRETGVACSDPSVFEDTNTSKGNDK